MPIRIKIPDKLRQGSERQTQRRLILAGVASLACILIAFGILLYYKIVIYNPQPSFIAYNTVEDEQPPKTEQRPIETSKFEVSPPISPINIEAITSPVSVSDFSLPAVAGASSLGGGLGGDGIGGGSGGGEGEPGMGASKPAASAFVGQLWDFKRNQHGQDSPYAGAGNIAFDKDVLTILSRFYNNGWKTGMFAAYRRLPTRLFTTAFYMPNCLESEAMHAYDPAGRHKLKSGRWAAVYKARVQAPASGRFRFVGIADSVMGVRFDGKNVLDCGLHSLSDGAHHAYHNQDRRDRVETLEYKATEAWNINMEGNFKNAYMAGQPFAVEQGKWYDMEVLISEIGGMEFGFCLLIDDMNDDDALKTEDGKPIYQLFRTVLVSPTADEAYSAMKYSTPAAGFSEESRVDPPYDSDSLVWPAQNPFSDRAEEAQGEDAGGFF